MSTQNVFCDRFDLRRGSTSTKDEAVAVDAAVCIFINDDYYRTLIASPDMLRELVTGHLVGEGIIKSLKEMKKVEIKPLRVDVELGGDIDLNLLNVSKVQLITTACGMLNAPIKNSQLEKMRIFSDVKVRAEDVWNMALALNKESVIHRKTGGTHSAMLCSIKGEKYAFAEDVGRHNAVDKVVGAGLLSGKDLTKCVLVSSGRQSGEMVLKAARSQIPFVVSVAGPLQSGIRIAETVGMTLICFVRGRRMNVYSHSERVKI